MSNYYGTGRTNYFRVVNVQVFQEWCKRWNLHFMYARGTEDHDEPLVGFHTNAEHGDPEDPDRDEAEWTDELPFHILPTEVCVYQHVGNQKALYLIGICLVITSDGIQHRVSLSDAYRWLAETGVETTDCNY